MNEAQVAQFREEFIASRNKQHGAELGVQVEELMAQNLLIANAIIDLGLNGSASITVDTE